MVRVQRVVAILLTLAIAIGVAASCALYLRQNPTMLALIDSDGNYSEEAFAHNLAANKRDGLTVFDKNHTDYVIIYPKDALPTLTSAIEDLVFGLQQISGAEFVAYDDSQAHSPKEICVGATNRDFAKSDAVTDAAAYYLASQGERIFIYSDSPYGASNGIYGFLEDYLGIMYMDKDYTYFPQLTKAVLPKLDDLQVPAFEVRDAYAKVTGDPRYRRRLRLTLDEVYDANGCHSAFSHIPVEKYFNEHPEYFAFIGGERRGDNYFLQKTQLCWSNPDVVDLLTASAERLAKNYEAQGRTRKIYWDISQMDSMNRCMCADCMALEERYSSPIAPILLAVNEVARRLPNYYFSTLAYHYGSVPPVGLAPEKNVLIKYCFMSEYGANDLSASVGQADSTISIRHHDEILGWGEIADNIYVWDYVTNYSNYFLPFPCFQSLQGNMQVMRDAGVTGVFSLGSYNERGSSDCMKSYLIAKLMWDPDCDFDLLMAKYFTLYFGAAAPYIRQIYTLQREYLEGKLWTYDPPMFHMEDYLSPAATDEYRALLDDAFEAAGCDQAVLKRLRYEQLCLTYADFKLGYGDKQQAQALLITLCDEFGIERLDEVGNEMVAKYR